MSGQLVALKDVDVCMIVCDEAWIIERSLAALLDAGFDSFVVVDMESRDATLDIIRRVANHHAAVYSYSRRSLLKFGYAEARNTCAAFARRDWVLFVDADEILVGGCEAGQIPFAGQDGALDIASIERRNLAHDTAVADGHTTLSSVERHNRLYKPSFTQRWKGYIHEEIHRSDSSAWNVSSRSTLVFDHYSALKPTGGAVDRTGLYAFMLLRAFKEPELREGTNSWWYDTYVPDHLPLLEEREMAYACGHGLVVSQAPSPSPSVSVRDRLLQQLWNGRDPFAERSIFCGRVDFQGWASDNPILARSIQEVRPRVVVEVGVWKGGSVITMGRELRRLGLDGVIVAVDTWLGAWDHWIQPLWFESLRMEGGYPTLFRTFAANVIEERLQDHVLPLPLDSLNAATVLKERGIVPDVVHIDGAHDYHSVFADLRAWWPLLAVGGILIGDDYHESGPTWPEVRQAFHEFFKTSKLENSGGKCLIRKLGP